MRKIDFYLQAFGFDNTQDFVKSTFGFMLSTKAIKVSSFFGIISVFIEAHFGLPIYAFIGFVFLNILEFSTGIAVAKKQKKPIESRKMGRMFLKVGVYVMILWILHHMSEDIKLPEIMNFEVKPFSILYWGFVAGVIYQLYKSLMENGVKLGWKELRGVSKFTNKKLDNFFEDDSNSSK